MLVEFYNKGTFMPLNLLDLPELNLEWLIKRLSLTFRNVGTSPYSVLDHSLTVCQLASEESAAVQLYALLHDISEALIGDIPGPLKQHIPQIGKLENKIQHQLITQLWPVKISRAKIKELHTQIKPMDIQAYELERQLKLSEDFDTEVFLETYEKLCILVREGDNK